ncbi:YbgC/FadM family acyl-CoA thioesterase [Cohnella sp. CFH 77786]|uniref:acyl-CoA thioesterase n=1 Tax=Cohnella sp. CFH 77786 TaxID=2662265 RepID=UPI001C60F352|nr:thioesterase family protein [Cohnella sp. CFH 77786]MBW5447425.1 YbgC/FadM family acyl-CoA thioesterase [Cohnella sp. CFH 77786]
MHTWYLHALRVRYQETDPMKVVYHANYLNWFEIGRTEWVRHAGISYRDMEDRGLLLPVTHLEASFEQPARYDDWVTVCTRAAEMSALRVRFQTRIVMGDLAASHGPSLMAEEPPGGVLVAGSTRHVWVNAAWKPVRLDREAPELYRKLKALADMPDSAQ